MILRIEFIDTETITMYQKLRCERHRNIFYGILKLELTFCSFHRIEQNICLVGTSINKGCAVYYYSVVMHGLRIIRYL